MKYGRGVSLQESYMCCYGNVSVSLASGGAPPLPVSEDAHPPDCAQEERCLKFLGDVSPLEN